MGFFSFKTSDTDDSISNAFSVYGPKPVKMVNPYTGEEWIEEEYEGYGVFGGKDIYELICEMNAESEDIDLDNMDEDKKRSFGIDLYFGGRDNELKWPVLLETFNETDPKEFQGMKPKQCPDQGYFYDYADTEYEDEWNDEDED